MALRRLPLALFFFFERVDAFEQLRQLAQHHFVAQRFTMIAGGIPRNHRAFGHVAPHAGLSGDGRARTDVHVTARADLSRDLDEVADRGRTGEPGLRRDCAEFADAAVVTDLHQVVDLRAVTNLRAADLRAIDATVSTDFDFVVEHHVADLRNAFEPSL